MAMQFGVFIVVSLALIKSAVVQSACRLEPRNLTVIGVPKSRTLNISWAEPEDNDNHIITYDVFYKASGSSWEEKTGVKETKATLQVKPYRTYDIFVMTKAKDVHGVASARLFNVTTPQEVPESCPKIETIAERQGSSIGVQWIPLPQEDRNGPLVSHVIVYRNCSMIAENKELNITVNITSDDEYIDIPDVGAGPYMFKVIAKNKVGFCKGYEKHGFISEELFRRPETLTCPPTPTPPVQSTVSQNKTTQQPQTPSPTPPPTTQGAQQTTQEPTKEPTKEPCPTITQRPCNCPSTKEPDSGTEKPAEKLSNTGDNNWLKYVAIALAVIIVIMGITIFLLIWQLYKNHRFYKLRRDQAYKMTKPEGQDNAGQDNA